MADRYAKLELQLQLPDAVRVRMEPKGAAHCPGCGRSRL